MPSSPPSSSIQPPPSSSPSSRKPPLTLISQSPPSGEYLPRTSIEITQRPPLASPTLSGVSSTTVRPRVPDIDREALKRIREVLDGTKAHTDDLRDGRLWATNHLGEHCQRCLSDNTELVERLQRLEDLIIRLAESQRHSRSDARGPRPRSASPTLVTEPIRPFTVPLPEPFIACDLVRRRPSRAGRLPRSSALAPDHPPETPVTTPDVSSRARPDTVNDFLEGVRQIRGRRPPAPRDGWIHSAHDTEPTPPLPPSHDQDSGHETVPAVMETRPWYPPSQPPDSSAPGAVPQGGQPGAVFTEPVILPPILDDIMAVVRENRLMHLASLEQQCELMKYVNSLNEWLGHNVEDHQAYLRGVSARIDQHHDGLNRLGPTRGPFPPPEPGVKPGDFIVPGGIGPGAPSPYGPPGPGTIVPPSHPQSHSTTSTTESPQPSVVAAPFPPTVFPSAPLPGVGIPPAAPPITVVVPSRASPGPGYRSPRESPRLYPETHAPSRYAEDPYQPIPPPVLIPTATHIEPEPFQYRRGAQYPESRTPSPRSPSTKPEEREPRHDCKPYRSPSPEYPVPIGVGPEYDRGVDLTVIQPPPVTHVHRSPSTYSPPSQTSPSSPAEQGGQPFPHSYGLPTQYPSTEQVQMPIGRPPTRQFRAPTIVEITDPELVQVYPPPDHQRPRTEPAPYQPLISGPSSEGRPISPSFECQVRDTSPSVPFVPDLPSEGSRHTYPPQLLGIPESGTYEHVRPESLSTPEEYEPLSKEPRGVPGVHPPGEERRVATGKAPTVPSEELCSAPVLQVSRVPTTSGVPGPETHGHIPPGSTIPSEALYGEEPRGAPLPGVSCAPTARGVPSITPRYSSGSGAVDYDDAERARQERFGDPERQMADTAQEAAESEMRREHEYPEKEAERDRQFVEKQAERDRQSEGSEARADTTLEWWPMPSGVPAPSPEDMLGSPLERSVSVIASIRRASTESAARYADDIRDIVQGEREEMARQLQAEREDTHALRAWVEELQDTRLRELEEELARARAKLDLEKQQRDHDEEMRHEVESQRIVERDEETRQQLCEITDILFAHREETRQQLDDMTDLILAHREEFARKEEIVDGRWMKKLEWRDEAIKQFQVLFDMVQGIIDNCVEERARCEEERRMAEQGLLLKTS